MTVKPQEGDLNITIKKNIATIQFSHPASNSLPIDILKKLANAFDLISKNTIVTVIIVKSKGENTFCAGASFDELVALKNFEQATVFFQGFANVLNAMRSCRQLIIGRAQGKTVGGGVGLLAACDYVFAHTSAAIKLSELSIGIGPFVIAPAVERKIGLAAFSELSIAASEWKSAAWAHQKGLYAKVLENVDHLDDEIVMFTEKLAAYNPEALLNMKKLLWNHTDHWETLLLENAKISGKLVLSDFTKTALAAFKK